ncbi:MAG TPA: hypothetical protein VFP05_17150 [Thermomicrobiales bacterium]|nr:hypothetical protein [Thermomicrobiales bacterium]
MQSAIEEIEQLILQEYPEADFEVDFDEESGATWVTVHADFEDDHWDDVVDIYIGRLLDIQDEWGLWLHFMPISTRAQQIHSSAA